MTCSYLSERMTCDAQPAKIVDDATRFKKLLYFDDFEELPKNAIFFRFLLNSSGFIGLRFTKMNVLNMWK